MSSIATCSRTLFSNTLSITFIPCSSNLIPLYDPQSKGSPLPLYKGTNTLFFQSFGMCPSSITLLHSSVSQFTLMFSSDDISSVDTPDNPGDFFLFILLNAYLTSSLSILHAGPSFIQLDVSLSHTFSSFINFSMYCFHVSLMPLSSTTSSPELSLRQLTFWMACLSFTICLAIL